MTNQNSRPSPLPLSDVETAWLAGIIEGEGCFTLYSGQPCVEIAMSDRDVIARAALLMNGAVYDIPQSAATKALGRLQMYRVRLRGAPAVAVMLQVRPHLGERRSARATELVLNWLESHLSHLVPAGPISSSTPQNTSSRSAA